MADAIFGNVREYTVSELAGAVKRVIEDEFGFVRVRGELGRVTQAGSGHVYLDLKDERAVLSGVIWKGNAARLRFRPEQGMEVIAVGRMSTFPGQSRYQLVIDSLEPAGVGALMALLEERKKKLAAEGLFAPERKRALPYLPETIGVVTSPSGAVIRDILHRLRERCPRHVLVWPTLVQGKGAETQIAAAIEGFNRLAPDGPVPRPDVLIVARGGGSLEDLWCFNEEIVARAAAASAIPIISAVGHETDTTLIDFVADLRAPTPSAAAEKAVPMRSELITELLNKQRRLTSVLARAFDARRAALVSAARGLGRPEDVIGPAAQRLDRAGELLRAGLRARRDAAAAGFLRAAGRFGPQILAAASAARRARLAEAVARLRHGAARLVERRWRRLSGERLSAAALRRQYAHGEKSLAMAGARLAALAPRLLDAPSRRLGSADQLLSALSHERVLERGFALVRGADGRLIARAKNALPGEAVALVFADGARGAVIDGGDEKPLSGGTRAAAKSRPGARRPAPAQKSLFD
ncbi:exodeoxyribonuclease VII large subunit [Amphiplicatus metriothermophilus]|nr:exodeoxyribonuclease VII large subunit [Amphiplicatus metriothermophilus]MBB5518101.1 exodeoxyribonuclease VII large subunit [Amphiplicatus metriothermophilus]